MTSKIIRHQDLEVYKKGFSLAMRLFELSRNFPKEETYSLTSQIRRASRSVCSNIAEAWRKRRYEAHFISKLSDVEGEAAESQTWIEFAAACEYMDREQARSLHAEYDAVIATIVHLINHAEDWVLPSGRRIK